MKPLLALQTLVLSVTLLTSCSSGEPDPHLEPCSQAWYQSVESRLVSGDGMGHGPDIGSEEWQSVIEFKLGIRGKAETPSRSTTAWCRYIEQKI